ncbi:MAG: DUF1320 domain-containing protein [Ignavibacteriales bacterium]|nr:DUF1320 domain-containing protein [Ignavibacteriales bacterium]
MSYCTQTGVTPGDIVPQRMSEGQLLKITTDDDDPLNIDQGIIDRAIADADELINGYCALKYSVPFLPVPGRVKTGSARIATFFLFEQAAARVGMPDSVRDAFDDEVAFWKDVAKGVASLGIDPPPANNSVTNAKVKSNDRLFTRDSMKGF